VSGFVREEQLERGQRLGDVHVRDDPHAAAVMVLVNDVVVERGPVRHLEKPPRVPGAGPGGLVTT
jgi:hypothetical protein